MAPLRVERPGAQGLDPLTGRAGRAGRRQFRPFLSEMLHRGAPHGQSRDVPFPRAPADSIARPPASSRQTPGGWSPHRAEPCAARNCGCILRGRRDGVGRHRRGRAPPPNPGAASCPHDPDDRADLLDRVPRLHRVPAVPGPVRVPPERARRSHPRGGDLQRLLGRAWASASASSSSSGSARPRASSTSPATSSRRASRSTTSSSSP